MLLRYVMRHYPGKFQHEAARNAGLRVPPMVLAISKTPGGAYRQFYAQWRRETDAGCVSREYITNSLP